MAAAGGIIKNLFGANSLVRQFFVWTVAQQLVNSVLGPMFQALTNQANHSNPNMPVTAPELADFVVRGIAGVEWATDEARKSGVSPNDFALMVHNAGVPPAIGDMLSLWRRGVVSDDQMRLAIRQSRVKPEWTDTVLKMGIQPPTPTDILDALLQGQISMDDAHTFYQRLGGDPAYFQLLYDTRGSAPTPNEAAEMARKGIIPWEGTGSGVVSFEQAFLEGPWRNKWLAPWRRTTEYLPPPRTITAMLREGSLTVAEATELLKKQGVPDALVSNYLTEASTTKTVKERDLAQSTISTLYQDNAIDDAKATELLKVLRYSDSEAAFVITTWRLARDLKFRNAGISTVHTQYINHRIGRTQVSTSLDKFGVPSAQRQSLIALWDEEAKSKVTLLTPAQIKSAFNNELLNEDDTLARLIQHGYSRADAIIYMQI